MPLIQLQYLHPGMRLAADVKNQIGERVAEKGCIITSNHIPLFRSSGVERVEVDAAFHNRVAKNDTPIDPGIQNRAVEEAMRHFRLTNLDHPAMIELFKLCIERNKKKLMKKGSHDSR
jgi:hypothetical protein